MCIKYQPRCSTCKDFMGDKVIEDPCKTNCGKYTSRQIIRKSVVCQKCVKRVMEKDRKDWDKQAKVVNKQKTFGAGAKPTGLFFGFGKKEKKTGTGKIQIRPEAPRVPGQPEGHGTHGGYAKYKEVGYSAGSDDDY